MQADSLFLSHLGSPTSSSLRCKKGMLPLLTFSALHHKPLCVTLFGHFHRQKPSSHHCLLSLSLGSWCIEGTEWNLLGRTNFLALSMPTYSLTPLSPLLQFSELYLFNLLWTLAFFHLTRFSLWAVDTLMLDLPLGCIDLILKFICILPFCWLKCSKSWKKKNLEPWVSLHSAFFFSP